MRIEELKLIPPSKRSSAVLIEFMKEHEKGLKAIKTLAEIKSILEYYENSKIGEKQEDGTYKLEFTFSDITTPYCINYDPKPAREALRKINEVEDEQNSTV